MIIQKDSFKEKISSKILTIRNTQVLLDKDLAEFYEIETKILNQAVKRNIERFPKEFMFQLSQSEVEDEILRSQFVTPSSWGGRRTLPYVFTEQGVSMLSAILKSKKAIEISIQIIQFFVEMRHFLLDNQDIFNRISRVESKLLQYDENFNMIFKSLSNKDPDKGIFYEGELFDSSKFILELIKKGRNRIILIDNYVDEKTLELFSSKHKNIIVNIYTLKKSTLLKSLEEKFNQQYGNLEIIIFKKSHDKFLIIDDEVYHIGASLKDLETKWFAFSKMNDFKEEILKRLNKIFTPQKYKSL